MTRLVGVRAVCDVCSAAPAVFFCVVNRHVLCSACDSRNRTGDGRNHQRVDLSGAVTALPFCEHCDRAPATSYCESEGSTLCDQCDEIVHKNKSCPQHERRLISKALAQRTVSFTGLPTTQTEQRAKIGAALSSHTSPSPVTSPTSRSRSSRRRSANPPVKRRAKRDSATKLNIEERRLAEAASRNLSIKPRNAPIQRRPAQMPYPDVAISTTLVSGDVTVDPYPQLGAPRALPVESADYFSGPLHNYFTGESSTPRIAVQRESSMEEYNGNLSGSGSASGSTRRSTAFYHGGSAAGIDAGAAATAATQAAQANPDATVEAAAAAAAAAGEMFLLSAASSDRAGSGSSDGLTPPFSGLVTPPDAAGLATAVAAAADSAAAAVMGMQARKPSLSSNASSGSEFPTGVMMGVVSEPFVMNSPAQRPPRPRRLPKPPRQRRLEQPVVMNAVCEGDPVFGESSERHVESSSRRTDAKGSNTIVKSASEIEQNSSVENQQGGDLHNQSNRGGVTYISCGVAPDPVVTSADEQPQCPLTDFDVPRDDLGSFGMLDLSMFETGSTNYGGYLERSPDSSADEADLKD